ncbi:MAG TPA: glycoside hydrolase family 15 protein [Candidatus Binatia bacterium]|nr:glycoside hydrolase family 15 protein [Candidatus Binatia bacterium]
MAYKRIEDHGIIGNMHTAALVAVDGAIDWLCFPHFDSPSVFAAILDDRKGGHLKISPTGPGVRSKQFYWPETNVLITRFFAPEGVAHVTDYMPVGLSPEEPGYRCLVRHIRMVRGDMSFRVECYPAFNYARDEHQTIITNEGACFESASLKLGLVTRIPLRSDVRGAVADFTLRETESATVVLQEIESSSECGPLLSERAAVQLFKRTVEYWLRWLSKCTYKGRWRESVHRSALALKLLTYEPTGAIIAAPTCSLPETLGGSRNWDYRYTWIRDAAFTLYGLMRIGFTEEAARFMSWLEARCHELEPDGSLHLMYGIDGRHVSTEETLDHLEGYKGSGPVRIGNNAHKQVQLDIYGELMDSVYLYNKYATPISYDLWTELRRLINWVCGNWHRKDEGIWETRLGRQHFVYSKLMCWVALDRGLRLADRRSFPADRERWLKVRDEIYEDIITNGWSAKRNAFVQHYGSEHLDAANLIMPLVFFLSPSDPRMLKTLDAIHRSPKDGGLVSNSLVYRYNVELSPDGLKGEEGTFNMCTFWLVEALTRAGAGETDAERLRQARLIFEEMAGYANHLGLYSEETGPGGEALGNFPQAFTHLSLISAAFNLDRALDKIR